jgi:hypothetical protein
MAEGCKSLLEIGYFWEHRHVLFDLANYVRVKQALSLQPFPDNQDFSARRFIGCVENGRAFVLNSNGHEPPDKLQCLVRICIHLASLIARFGQLYFHGRGERRWLVLQNRCQRNRNGMSGYFFIDRRHFRVVVD